MLIDAATARQRATDHREMKFDEELKLCEKEILTAINSGELSCTIYQQLSQRAVKQLEWLGYKVSRPTMDVHNEISHQISWGASDES